MNDCREQGFALVAVLCWSILLSLAAGAIILISQSQASSAHSGSELARLDAAADAAINVTLVEMLTPNNPATPPTNGKPFRVSLLGKDIAIRVTDETGKLDLNFSPRPTIVRFLRLTGLPLDSAEAGADKLLDWREAGFLKRLNGAKRDDYQKAGYSYGPRQGSFRSVGELQLVMDFDSQTFAALEPALTVFSQDTEIDPVSATALAAQLSQPNAVTGSFGSNLTTSSIGQSVPRRLIGHAFAIRASVVDAGYTATRTAIVRLSGNSHEPIWVYRWS